MAITTKPAAAATPVKALPAWAKRGAASIAALETSEKESAMQAEMNRKMWRFWVEDGGEARVTFVDGNVMEDGSLDFFSVREHNIMLKGKWGNTFICTSDSEPCPICASGDKPSMVAIFTVIDQRTTKSKDGTKTYKDVPKLFVAKRDTLKTLMKLGEKRGGLAGCTFDICRTGDKSASVGSMFDFVEKTPIPELKEKYSRKNADTGKMETFFVAANYEAEMQYRTADELRAAIPDLVAPLGHVSKADADLVNEL